MIENINIGKRGGKRDGAGRKFLGNHTERVHICIDKDAHDMLMQIQQAGRGNFVSIAIRDRWKKGYGAKIEPITQAANMLNIDENLLREFVMEYRQKQKNQ